ncbi:MAG: hypothetical protein F6K55_08015 [Moorea sp. SIO4A3]|nr:hypothetical protein [Moorena sp. SIO4A3]
MSVHYGKFSKLRCTRFPIPDSRFPFPSWEGLGVGSDSLGALTVVELNSPRVAPLPIPDSLKPNRQL